VEGLEMLAESLVEKLQSGEIFHAAERPFHEVARLAQPAPVHGARRPVRLQQRLGASPYDFRHNRLLAVRAISMECLWSGAKAVAMAVIRRDCIEHVQHRIRVRVVGRSSTDYQRNAVGISHDMGLQPFVWRDAILMGSFDYCS
jgi:hypothetical protein